MLPLLRILCLAELVTLLGCSLAFASFALQTSALCFTSPCMAENVAGYELWRVSDGLSFATVMSSFALVAFPLYGLWLAKQQSPLVVAAGFVGGGLVVVMLTSMMIGLWRSIFVILRDTNNKFRMGGQAYELNHDAEALARGLSSAAIGYLCVAVVLILPIIFNPTLFRSEEEYQEVQQHERPASRRRPTEIELKNVQYGSLPDWQSGV